MRGGSCFLCMKSKPMYIFERMLKYVEVYPCSHERRVSEGCKTTAGIALAMHNREELSIYNTRSSTTLIHFEIENRNRPSSRRTFPVTLSCSGCPVRTIYAKNHTKLMKTLVSHETRPDRPQNASCTSKTTTHLRRRQPCLLVSKLASIHRVLQRQNKQDVTFTRCRETGAGRLSQSSPSTGRRVSSPLPPYSASDRSIT